MVYFASKFLQQPLLAQIVLATEFQITCTLPPAGTNFVSGPNVRSTLSIFWSCLLTLVICTWTVLHLSIPGQKPKGFERLLKAFLRKLKWMLVTVLIPEYLIGKSLGEFISAHRFLKKKIKNDTQTMEKHGWTLTHAFYADMGGFVIPREGVRHEVAVHSRQLLILMRRELISKEPPISKDEINDKSKGDMLVKGIALLQIIWLVVQLITRKVKDLPTAQLEIVTLSFAICTFITYILWLEKPQDVKIPTYLDLNKNLSVDDIGELEKVEGYGFLAHGFFGLKYPSLLPRIPADFYAMDFLRPTTIGPKSGYDWGMAGEDVGFTLGGIVFGACHMLAWNFSFPTAAEKTLWRVASVVSTALVPIFYLMWAFMFKAIARNYGRYKWISIRVNLFMAFIYSLCRLYILAEVFRSLFYLPPGAFVGTWAVSFPHVS